MPTWLATAILDANRRRLSVRLAGADQGAAPGSAGGDWSPEGGDPVDGGWLVALFCGR